MPIAPAPVASQPKKSDDAGAPGYRLEPTREASVLVPSRRSRPVPDVPPRGVFTKRKASAPMADGLLPPLERPETNWFVSVVYPLRGADSLGVIAATSAVLWFFTVLVPEYCLALIGDAESMGASSLGRLIALISILPFVLLLPLVIFYWLQYLGRALVSSAMGEARPPRSPDRNFDGFMSGLSPWLIWLALGPGVGLLPLFSYGYSLNSRADFNPVIGLGLFLLGFPYVLMAMMMSFLHDHALAAVPWNVVMAMFRLGASFGFMCVFIAGLLALALATFVLTLQLRANHLGIAIVCALGSWVCVQWASIVVMRVMGTYYHHHRDRLHWHHERPRWGVAWRL
jgi:hypothetical protein